MSTAVAADAAAPASSYENLRSRSDAAGAGGAPPTPHSVRRVRLTFAAFILLGGVLALLMRTPVLRWPLHFLLEKPGCTDDVCVSAQGAYRVSFALTLFYLFHWLMSTPLNLFMDSESRVAVNRAHLLIKLLGFVVLLIAVTFIPNNFYVVFAWLALVLSALFLVCQLFIIIEFAYSWNDRWAAREETRFKVGLLVCSAVLIMGSIAGIGVAFHNFGNHKECGLNQGFLTLVLVAAMMYFPGAIAAPHGALLPSAAVFAYTAFTAFTGAMATPPGQCNTMGQHHSKNSAFLAMVLGYGMSAGAIAYSAFSSATSREAFMTEREAEASEEEQEARGFAFLHVMMLLGSAYVSMVATDWAVVGATPGSHLAVASVVSGNRAAVWAKFGSEIMCLALYGWSLVAPMICPDRDFSWD